MDDLPDLQLVGLSGYEPVPEALLTGLQSGELSKKRRPPNAFLIYCTENRAEFRAENPDRPNIEISRMLADRWKEMDEECRAPYRRRAQDQQAEFKQTCPDYHYDKAKLRRARRPLGHDMKLVEFPDLVTLVNLPIDELRACINVLQGQVLMSCQQSLPQFMQSDAEAFPRMEHGFVHDVFQGGQ
jgi:hypothetical protein